MALKIKQNGEIKDLIIPACGVEVLDMEDNFGSSNLEEVLQELGEGDSVYISDEEPDKDGIWISSDNTTIAGENPTLTELKEYVNENLNKMDKKVEVVSSQLNDLAMKNYTETTVFKNAWNIESGGTILRQGNCVTLNLNTAGGIITPGTIIFTVPNEIKPQSAKNIIAFCYGNPFTVALCALNTNGDLIIVSGVNNNSSLRFAITYSINN